MIHETTVYVILFHIYCKPCLISARADSFFSSALYMVVQFVTKMLDCIISGDLDDQDTKLMFCCRRKHRNESSVWSYIFMLKCKDTKVVISCHNSTKDRLIESNTCHRCLIIYLTQTSPQNLFFILCGEILLGCVLFGHITWNEYIWQWTNTSPFYRTIWLGKSI